MIDDSVRSTSFGRAAREYDRYRVGPTREIVGQVISPDCGVALDLGAGTGAMTRLLLERIPRVYAVDPDPRMREVLAENCPAATVLEGAAERIPLPDGSVDAVVASSSWHWVDPVRAVPEVARVLRESGTLGLVWTRRDDAVDWVSDLEDLRQRATESGDQVRQQIRRFLEDPWLPEGSPFTDIEIARLPWSTKVTREELLRMLTTFAGFITAPDERKPAILREFADHLAGESRLGTEDLVELPMVSCYWRARRV